jgi:FAD/FMN-containing dehydrogenase
MTDVSELRARVTGPVFVAGDDGYAEESTSWILNFTHTPDVVVGAASTQDVVEAVQFAAANHLPVRVQDTGHGSHAAITDGVLITTRRLDTIRVDAGARTATIGAGVSWDPVIATAGEHGLAPITGSSGTVGAIGFLLGGGLGPLVNSYGFGSDWVRSFEVVLANGKAVTASADDHPDLFWALRGGKGGLGVVTSATLELVELPTLYGGSLTFDTEHIEAALHGWANYLDTAEPNVSSSVAVVRMPDLPFIPEPVRGRTLLSVRFAYTGDAVTGEKLAAPLRAAAPVYLDELGEMPASAIGAIHNDPPNPTVGWTSGRMLRAIDQDFVTTLLEFVGADKQVPFAAVEVRAFGPGLESDVPGGSAVGGRAARGSLNLVGAPNAELFAVVLPAATDALLGALAPWLSAENNVNFANGFATVQEFRGAWSPETFARLAQVRTTYDPDGLFPYGVHVTAS